MVKTRQEIGERDMKRRARAGIECYLFCCPSPSAFCFVFIARGDDWIILFEICKSGGEKDILTCWMWKQWSFSGENISSVCLPRVVPQIHNSKLRHYFWQNLYDTKKSKSCDICIMKFVLLKNLSWTFRNRSGTMSLSVHWIVSPNKTKNISILKKKKTTL